MTYRNTETNSAVISKSPCKVSRQSEFAFPFKLHQKVSRLLDFQPQAIRLHKYKMRKSDQEVLHMTGAAALRARAREINVGKEGGLIKQKSQ